MRTASLRVVPDSTSSTSNASALFVALLILLILFWLFVEIDRNLVNMMQYCCYMVESKTDEHTTYNRQVTCHFRSSMVADERIGRLRTHPAFEASYARRRDDAVCGEITITLGLDGRNSSSCA